MARQKPFCTSIMIQYYNIISMATSGTDWLEAPTVYKAYVSVRGYTPKSWLYMLQYLHFRILEFPLIIGDCRIDLNLRVDRML